MIDHKYLQKNGYNDLNLILDLVIVNRYRAKYIDLALDVLDTIQHNVENQVTNTNFSSTFIESLYIILEWKYRIFENTQRISQLACFR